ncbi:hypothetical protein [Nostoc punctiforme]|uniref:Uncharacterized protein n=1 Tax=Nostoc punctiforme (strain ATCC 29133 / PCC 73102) TaxID=63737 RepID=B2J1H7_NOSP7|nr:hypothetical protein [Nostoc punctiforme]ACC80338.1 hypothetical protein Npun_F1666 [Nostoc punctiforme PCC 73102]
MTTEPTLVQIFGAGAVQDSASLTIQKAALTAVGLTASSNNSAESLLIALLLVAKENLTPENHDINLDQSVTITNGVIPSFVARGTSQIQYRQDTFTVAVEKPEGLIVIDPDDY